MTVRELSVIVGGLADLMMRKFDDVDKRFDSLETRFTNLETRVDCLDNKVDGLIDYVNDGFVMLSNRMDKIERNMATKYELQALTLRVVALEGK